MSASLADPLYFAQGEMPHPLDTRSSRTARKTKIQKTMAKLKAAELHLQVEGASLLSSSMSRRRRMAWISWSLLKKLDELGQKGLTNNRFKK
jgi:hypothetical protein